MKDLNWTLELIRLVVLCILLIIGAYTEISKGKIYNWLTVPSLLIGLAIAYLLTPAPETPIQYQTLFNLTSSLLGVLIGGGFFFVMYCLGAMGAGDVKMMGAVGALGGWWFTLWALVYITIIGGIMAIAVLIWRGKILEGMRDGARMLFIWRAKKDIDKSNEPADQTNTQKKNDTVPYGLAIAIGTILALLFLGGFGK